MTDHKPAEETAREWLRNHSAEDGNIYNASPADGSEVKGLQDLLEAGPLHSLAALLTTREVELRAEVERSRELVTTLCDGRDTWIEVAEKAEAALAERTVELNDARRNSQHYEQQSRHASEQLAEVIHEKAEAQKERDGWKSETLGLREECDRYRMAPTAGGGFRFEWRDRAIKAEADLAEAQKRVERLEKALRGAVEYIDQSHDIADFEPWVIECRAALAPGNEEGKA